MNDPYYSPEAFGLELLDDYDIAGSWEFDMIAVWRRKADGALFYAFDSGCSCPSPFESDNAETLTPLTDVAAFATEARTWLRNNSYHGVGAADRDAVERIIRDVRAHLKGEATKDA